MQQSNQTHLDERPTYAGERIIPINRLKPSKYQTRHVAFDVAEDIENLANSILSLGMIELPSVREIGDHYEIITGHRRIRAISQYLRWDSVKCRVYQNIDELRAFQMAVTDNVHRANLSPYEEDLSYLICQKMFGFSEQRICQLLNRSRFAVSSRKQLAISGQELVNNLSQEDARKFLQNYSLGHLQVLRRLDKTKIGEAVNMIKNGASIQKLMVLEASKEKDAVHSDNHNSAISQQSTPIKPKERLWDEIDRLKDEAPQNLRPKIYLLQDTVEELVSKKRRVQSFDFTLLEQEVQRQFDCPHCKKSLSAERYLDEKSKSLVFEVKGPSDIPSVQISVPIRLEAA